MLPLGTPEEDCLSFCLSVFEILKDLSKKVRSLNLKECTVRQHIKEERLV